METPTSRRKAIVDAQRKKWFSNALAAFQSGSLSAPRRQPSFHSRIDNGCG